MSKEFPRKDLIKMDHELESKNLLSPTLKQLLLERPASSPPQVSIGKCDDPCTKYKESHSSSKLEKEIIQPILKNVRSTPNNRSSIISDTGRPLSRHSSLSYVSSPLDGDNWEGDHDIPSSVLSWRGSDFEASTPQLPSELGVGSRSTSTISPSCYQNNNQNAYENESEGTSNCSKSNKQWKSPHLERRRYLQKGQEDKYRETLRRRNRIEDANRSPVHTPTEVADLEKMSVFQNFSKEELEVISKSLTRKESERSNQGLQEPLQLDNMDNLFDCQSTDSYESSTLLKQPSENSNDIEKSFQSLVGNVSDLRDGSEDSCRSLGPESVSSQERRDSFISKEWEHENSTVKRRPSFSRESLERARKEVASLISSQPVSQPLYSGNSRMYYGGQSYSDELLSPHSKENFLRFQMPASHQHEAISPLPVSGRYVNVGLFRNLARFPFNSQTVPVPASRNYEQRLAFNPSDRRYVRPQVFGEVLRNPRRRGIHFGPPKNPQCSCDSCCSSDVQMSGSDGLLTGRMRAWSLSDLDPAEADSTKTLPYSSNSLHPLSRNHSNASDISSLPCLGKLDTLYPIT